jgi:hypothetical protein
MESSRSYGMFLALRPNLPSELRGDNVSHVVGLPRVRPKHPIPFVMMDNCRRWAKCSTTSIDSPKTSWCACSWPGFHNHIIVCPDLLVMVYDASSCMFSTDNPVRRVSEDAALDSCQPAAYLADERSC